MNLLFLSKTLVQMNKIEDLHYVLDFDSYFSVDRTDRGDNLALFLRTTFNCQIVNFSNNHGNVDIVDTTSVCGNLPATTVTLMGDIGELRGISFFDCIVKLMPLGVFLVISMIFWMQIGN